jgi:hypothetical protein
MVNGILGGLRLDDFLKSATREQVLELRASASAGLTAEKKILSADGLAKNQKYINFLSAVIQECDKTMAIAKKSKLKLNGDFLAVVSEYEKFRRITKSVAGDAAYSEIIKQLEKELEQ